MRTSNAAAVSTGGSETGTASGMTGVAPTAGAIAASATSVCPIIRLGEPAGVEPAGRLRRHDATPPQHGDAVGDGDDLAQLVGDEHDADALGAQPADRAEQGVDVQRGEHSGRLVEDQHPAVVVQRLDDLDTLALANRQPLDPSIGIDADPDPGGGRLDGAAGRTAVDGAEADRGEHHVLRHGHRSDEGELLGHHPDAGRHRLLR